MEATKKIKLDCMCFEDIATEQGIKITEKTETGHNEITYYATTKDGRSIKVVEKSFIYDCDAYATEIEVYPV